MSRVFQQNSLRLLGGVYPDNLTFSHKQTIKTFYGINANDTITLLGLNNTRLNLQVSIKEFYLFKALKRRLQLKNRKRIPYGMK